MLDQQILPYDQLLPLAWDQIVKHSDHLSQAARDFNDIDSLYESALRSPLDVVTNAKFKFPSLELENSNLKKNLGDLTKKVTLLEKEHSDMKGVMKDYEACIERLTFEQSSSTSIISSLNKDLDLAWLNYKELFENHASLLSSQDSALKRSASSARKEVKNQGKSLFVQLDEHVDVLTKRSSLQSDINELRSNKYMLERIRDGYVILEEEIAKASSSLDEVEAELNALPSTSFDLKGIAPVFEDSLPFQNSDFALQEGDEVPQASAFIQSPIILDPSHLYEEAETMIAEMIQLTAN